MIVISSFGFGLKRAKKIRIQVTDSRTGQAREMKIRKHKPQKCSAARRICIACKKTSIHKNSANYEFRICKTCAPAAHPGCPIAGIRPSRPNPSGKYRPPLRMGLIEAMQSDDTQI